MSSVAIRFASQRIQAIEEVVEEWAVGNPSKDEDAEAISKIEDLIREMTNLIGEIHNIVRPFDLWKDPSLPPVLIVYAHNVGYTLERMTKVLGMALANVNDRSKSLNHRFDGLADLLISQNELAQIKSKFTKRWMLPDQETVRKSKQAFAEGRYRVL